MEKTFAKVDELVVHIKTYLNNRIDMAKLNAVEKGSKMMAHVFTLALSLIIFGLTMVFASFALAFAFAKLTGELYWGFLIVAGIYLVLTVLLWAFREKLLRIPILNFLLKQLFKDEDENVYK